MKVLRLHSTAIRVEPSYAARHVVDIRRACQRANLSYVAVAVEAYNAYNRRPLPNQNHRVGPYTFIYLMYMSSDRYEFVPYLQEAMDVFRVPY